MGITSAIHQRTRAAGAAGSGSGESGRDCGQFSVVAHSLWTRASYSVAITHAAHELMESALGTIHRMRQPVIAAVNGAALGGGFALASACDMGASYHLPRLVGASRAAEPTLTGCVFDAAEAARNGLYSGLSTWQISSSTLSAKPGKSRRTHRWPCG